MRKTTENLRSVERGTKAVNSLERLLATLPPICGAPLDMGAIPRTVERCSLPPGHKGDHGRKERTPGTTHYDVRTVNPQVPTGVRLMVHVRADQAPRLIRELASGLMLMGQRTDALISIPFDGDFHVDDGGPTSGTKA